MAIKYLTPTIILMLAGCAVDHAEKFQNQAADIETREAFERQQRKCKKFGGAMVIPSRGTRIPTNRHTRTDYHKAGCYSP